MVAIRRSMGLSVEYWRLYPNKLSLILIVWDSTSSRRGLDRGVESLVGRYSILFNTDWISYNPHPSVSSIHFS